MTKTQLKHQPEKQTNRGTEELRQDHVRSNQDRYIGANAGKKKKKGASKINVSIM